MKKILYLPTRYFPSISGAEFYLQRIAEILSTKYNYNIDIFTSNAIDFKALRFNRGKTIDKQDRFYESVNNLKINRFAVNYNISDNIILNKIKKIKAFKSLNLSDECVKKFIKNGPYSEELIDYFLMKKDLNYDLIHTTFYPYFNLIVSLIIGKMLNKPKICTPFFHFANPRYSDLDLVEVLKKFDIIITCTFIEKKFLIENLKIPRENIKVISMGVDFNRFEKIHKSTFKNYYFKDVFFDKKEKNRKLILFCGNKNYEKGAISILKSIPLIIKKIKTVNFIFIGPSTPAFNYELKKIQKITNTKIINFTPDNLTGYYDKKKLTAFKESDLFLMPSRSDAFGISFLEAWASGKPVIGARIGSTPEVIRENIDGFLVEFDNPNDIAQKAIKLLKSKRLRKKLGSAGQLKVSKNYTWDIVAKKTHKLYQTFMNI
ncbi:MAG: glycosyltransferase family 4 protein [Promethearchaeota archaeon]